jgi:trimethylamine---corrinoid protein Co-methyltransferase
MQNAVVLAGITLTQIVNPGCPVIYGVGGSPIDMQTGAYYIGGPELPRAIQMGVAMARRYGLPCRGGGALTDSHQVDFQAGAQSAFSIEQSLAGGIDFIVHSCGILGSYLAMSYEKFVADEDLCRHALYLKRPLDLSDLELEVEAIREVGVGGQFLTHERTVKFCHSEPFRSPLMNRLPFEKWEGLENRAFLEKASALVRERLDRYRQPPIEKNLLRDLSNYVRIRKEEIG